MDWKLVQKQAEALLEGERELIPNLANLSALLKESMEELNWVGFYLEKRGELLLGPFQGKPACIHIPWKIGLQRRMQPAWGKLSACWKRDAIGRTEKSAVLGFLPQYRAFCCFSPVGNFLNNI